MKKSLIMLFCILIQGSLSFIVVADDGITCEMPDSDAVAINIEGKTWWDHAHLTIAVQAHPKADSQYVQAIHNAITAWSYRLSDCFDGQITLEDVTDSQPSQHRAADIVIHYVPKAGGSVWNGFTVCGDHKCNNVLVRSDYPDPMGVGTIPDFAIGFVAQHEIGHALGLGHATNLWESWDLMGYGWVVNRGSPIVSRCDMEALQVVFSWVFEGTEPHPPIAGSYMCQSQ